MNKEGPKLSTDLLSNPPLSNYIRSHVIAYAFQDFTEYMNFDLIYYL